MKKKLIPGLAAAAVATIFLAAPGAQATTFEGYTAGLKAGLNFASNNSLGGATTFTLGAEGGYLIPAQSLNLNLPANLRIGGDAFFDLNMSASHASYWMVEKYGTVVIGADAKVGYVMGRFMPYAKFGLADLFYTGDYSGDGGSVGLHMGVGAEYLLSQAVGATVEWTNDSAGWSSNNNITVGAVYHF